MKTSAKLLSRCSAILLVCALAAPSIAHARPLSAEAAHTRIKRRGLGNWVGVELQNGTAFSGRIVSIDPQSFGLQLHNDPTITTLSYSDVVRLETGSPHSAFWIITGAGIAGTVAIALIAHHELDNAYNAHTAANLPTLPRWSVR